MYLGGGEDVEDGKEGGEGGDVGDGDGLEQVCQFLLKVPLGDLVRIITELGH